MKVIEYEKIISDFHEIKVALYDELNIDDQKVVELINQGEALDERVIYVPKAQFVNVFGRIITLESKVENQVDSQGENNNARQTGETD